MNNDFVIAHPLSGTSSTPLSEGTRRKTVWNKNEAKGNNTNSTSIWHHIRDIQPRSHW